MQLNVWNENTKESEVSNRVAAAGLFAMQISSLLMFFGISQSMKHAVSTEQKTSDESYWADDTSIFHSSNDQSSFIQPMYKREMSIQLDN